MIEVTAFEEIPWEEITASDPRFAAESIRRSGLPTHLPDYTGMLDEWVRDGGSETTRRAMRDTWSRHRFEVVDTRTEMALMPVIAFRAPTGAGAEASVDLDTTVGGSAGFSFKILGVGGGATIKITLEIHDGWVASDGACKLVALRVPVLIESGWIYDGDHRVGEGTRTRAQMPDVRSVVLRTLPPAECESAVGQPLGDRDYRGDTSSAVHDASIEVSLSAEADFSLGWENPDKDATPIKVGVTVKIEGSVVVTCGAKLPAGHLYRLSGKRDGLGVVWETVRQ